MACADPMKKIISFPVSTRMFDAVEKKASSLGVSRSEVVRYCLIQTLELNGEKNGTLD